MKTRLIVLLVMGLHSIVCASLPPVAFNTISSVDGLPQNTGRVIMQDRDGFVWIGTEDGLVRFDGYSMLAFRRRHNDPTSLSDNYVSALAQDPAGNIWVGTMGGGLNIIDPRHRHVSRIPGLSSADIRHIVPDPKRDIIWIGAGDGLYYLENRDIANEVGGPGITDDAQTVHEVPLTLPDGILMGNAVSGIVVQDDKIWISSRGSGLCCYDPATKSVQWYQAGENGLADNTFNTLAADQRGNIWAGSQSNGLVQVFQQTGKVSFKHFDTSNSDLSANDVMTIAEADHGNLWIGTWGGGVALFHPDSGNSESYQYYPGDKYSVPSNIIMDIVRTRSGQVWIGTFDKGVCWFNPDAPFHVYNARPDGEAGRLPSNLVWSFASDQSGSLWIGTGKGLTQLDSYTQQYKLPSGIEPAGLWDKVRGDDIRALLVDGDDLWIAARKNGVVKLSVSTGVVSSITSLLAKGQSLTNDYIRLMVKDSQGFLWLGAAKGLNRFNRETGEIRAYTKVPGKELSLPHYRVRALFEDSKKRMWVGTSDGLMLVHPDGEVLKVWRYPAEQSSGLQLAGKGIRGVGEDSLGRIWLATEGGVSIYDEASESTTILREENGLPSNATYCAIDGAGFMWISTLHGLARVDISTLEIETYLASDGMPDDEFNFNAWHKLPDGRLVFGTLSGLTIFSPDMVPGPEKAVTPPPLQVQPYVYNALGEKVTVDQDFFEKEKKLVSNRIAFEYKALFFANPSSVQYEVKLQGADLDWQKTGMAPFIAYSNLAPGKYSFEARAKSAHGQWVVSSSPVSFEVAQKIWKTPLAYFLYTIAAAGGFVVLFFLYSRRLRNNEKILKYRIAESTRELEVSNTDLAEKNSQLDRLMAERERLFRAIAHELRTPLSMIMSLLEVMKADWQGDSATMSMAYQNATRLGYLLDNILDLSRKQRHLQQEKELFEVQTALEECLNPYRQQIQLKNKQLIEKIDLVGVWLFMHRDAFMLMVSNLLSNACKYTEDNGIIELNAQVLENTLQIEVADNGIGVLAGEEERIFHWFERGRQSTFGGWGVGLAYVKDEAEAVGGTIRLEQSEARGALFILSLPLASGVRDVPKSSSTSREHPVDIDLNSILPDNTKRYSILIVEDNTDLLHHLPTLFPDHWTILTAADAETGWSLSLEKLPDLILTDLMLPGESGFDLTRKLKGDDRTAHIQIVILTAMANEENRLAGLGFSTDSFMGKPFKNKELLLRIYGLLANRERIFSRAKRIVLNMKADSEERADDDNSVYEDPFLEKLHGAMAVHDNISSITLEEVASQLAMSKRSFQREMERLGISWREYKRLRKLRYAMDLLRNPNTQIGEIAEKAGYSSAAHFSKLFKEYTGSTPSAWRNNLERPEQG
ncbi:two-component regulator propeller domain-containing protein [Desulforhopalus sp. IMCC35007]|uniref:two-component regulator propeller domain-containing protein n=1 Tax=Desulforhopalus sp. IMCC35007 TaxID=2569543 RepID=UPI0010AE3D12|nr:two-component regulator propeller domain-containing protein [Desulforhopalus sp. IMCC35007]TKB11832.1 helix-turn-helix domain-containing protein [Desulforhopalus sp. IMCC35007]